MKRVLLPLLLSIDLGRMWFQSDRGKLDKHARPVEWSANATKAPAATTSTTISLSAAGTAYLAAVAPANSALTVFNAAADGWTSSTTNAQAANDAKPLISSLQSLDTVLTNDQWPTVATTDVHTLIGDLGELEWRSSRAFDRQPSEYIFVDSHLRSRCLVLGHGRRSGQARLGLACRYSLGMSSMSIPSI